MILGVRACMLTIRHYVTNTTDSQNAGALHWGHTLPESYGQHRATTATQHRSSGALVGQHHWSSDHPGSLSHGGVALTTYANEAP